MATTLSARSHRAISLRTQLFLWLALPLTGVLLLAAMVFYPIATFSVRTGYDQALMDTAHSLARLIPALAHPGAIVSSDADIVLRLDQFDRIYYSVHGPSGELVAGDKQLAAPAPATVAAGGMFYNGEISGQPVRVAALRVLHEGAYFVVQAAETTVKRRTLGRQVLTGLAVVEVVLIAAVASILWFGIQKGLAPLERLRGEIEVRSHRDLRPVPKDHVPIEAWPVVLALNNLLDRLAVALRSEQTFVANAAHQLRTPLTGLRMQLEYALHQKDPLEWQRALATLAPVTARIIHLVNQLLTLAKAEGGSDTAMEMVDLAQLAQDLAAEWMPQAIEKDIDLGLEVAPAAVRGQTFLLRELVSNLLDNAIRYSPQGGRVTLRTRALEGMAVLEVEDEGPGIPPAERRHVFRRFYRLNGVSGDGCGLGLSIVDEIARIHGARVSIEDASSASGTLVSVAFPSGKDSAADTIKDCADSDTNGQPLRP